ncbi:MAG: hypothetical protein KAH32_01120 [Chlamydiia bacterium]|nr:hypothetical protein [Chlamydiia bacterium]
MTNKQIEDFHTDIKNQLNKFGISIPSKQMKSININEIISDLPEQIVNLKGVINF